ncbi:Protein EXECUTER 1 [Hirschfeldia incana]|nr:Protein EXECUTER 1 [Hirschfeldia incana]
MTSLSPSQNLAFSPAATSSRLAPAKRPFYPHRLSSPVSICRCSSGGNSSSPSSSSDDGGNPRWDAAIQDVLKNAIKRFDSVMSWYGNQDKDAEDDDAVSGGQGWGDIKKEEESDWDWERWKKHFERIDDQDRLLSVLKSQLNGAVKREDYEDAARLKVAIAAASTNDAVGRAMSSFNRALLEERYKDAVYLRDEAGAGLVGWWSGISEDVKDPFGLIVQITAEHGRYVARSYNPRQLSTSATGAPLFEIFLTLDAKGNYKKQAVYLKWKEIFPDVPTRSPNTPRLLTPPVWKEDAGNLSVKPSEDEEESDNSDNDSDLLDESSGFQTFLRDMIPGVKVKVMNVNSPGKADKDFISKVIDQIADEEDEENDFDIEEIVVEDETKSVTDGKNSDMELESVTDEVIDTNGGKEIAIKLVISDIVGRLSGNQPLKESLRSPANLESVEKSSFYIRLEKDLNVQEESKGVESRLVGGKGNRQSRRRIDSIMVDLAKSIEKEKKISVKMLKDVGELLSLTLSQAQNRQQLSGLTKFRRIDVTPSLDPLDGLYIGAHGLYTSEVIHLKRKFGQWKGGKESKKKSKDIEFYEYVEAVKLTGDPYVPAGKVAFRAKIGRRYELPHRGLIPEEFGVIARYKGQGRLADPGFRNPRWVDGELVILDGKYVKGGPVVGFVYWAPEYHFVMFFNRLRLQA